MLTWELSLITHFSFKSGFSKFFCKKSQRSWFYFEISSEIVDLAKKCLPSLLIRGLLLSKLILTVSSRYCWIWSRFNSLEKHLHIYIYIYSPFLFCWRFIFSCLGPFWVWGMKTSNFQIFWLWWDNNVGSLLVLRWQFKIRLYIMQQI